MDDRVRFLYRGPREGIPESWTVDEDMPVVRRGGFRRWFSRCWDWLRYGRCQGCGSRGTELDDGFCGYCADD